MNKYNLPERENIKKYKSLKTENGYLFFFKCLTRVVKQRINLDGKGVIS